MPPNFTNCDNVNWPGGNWGARLQSTVYDTTAWYGSLAVTHRDATGDLFRRNRYYDPKSGQFTQADPIGLAGGLNLYGFAEGDPVNFSDPFGLEACADREREELCNWFEASFAMLGAMGGFLGGGGAGALAIAGSGGVLAPAAVAATAQSTATGAAAGLTLGSALSPFLFSKEGGDPAAGLRRQLARHQERLEQYRADPDAFDNRGFLQNAPNEEVRRRIIGGRIRNLQRQIDDFIRQIRALGG